MFPAERGRIGLGTGWLGIVKSASYSQENSAESDRCGWDSLSAFSEGFPRRDFDRSRRISWRSDIRSIGSRSIWIRSQRNRGASPVSSICIESLTQGSTPTSPGKLITSMPALTFVRALLRQSEQCSTKPSCLEVRVAEPGSRRRRAWSAFTTQPNSTRLREETLKRPETPLFF